MHRWSSKKLLLRDTYHRRPNLISQTHERNVEIGIEQIERGTGFEPATSTLGTIRQPSLAVHRYPLPSAVDRELSRFVYRCPCQSVVKTVVKATFYHEKS